MNNLHESYVTGLGLEFMTPGSAVNHSIVRRLGLSHHLFRSQIFSYHHSNACKLKFYYFETYEPPHEKICLRDLPPGKAQTGLLSYRSWLGSWNLGFSMYRYYTIQAANNKGADQTARMRRLICAFVVRIWHKQVFSWLGSNSRCSKLLMNSYLNTLAVQPQGI